ncbi:MAG TPA: Nramp family divalent metal transporter [Bryobacteraceae bacterium]|nr:Nramp family divalent metal transporter [Bryobacteraceae bacterium]
MSSGHTLDLSQRSLADVHSTVATTHVSIWRRMFAFAGPAYLVSVGYMDPGNWATDLEGGAKFGYRLLWVLVMSNAMAILLQTLSARLGIVSGRDLAQACRETYPRPVTYALWVLSEIAIAACDLAEVLGAAIGLNLLFHIPLLAGVVVTAADTLLVLWFQRFGIRMIEAFVLALITVIAGCFCIEILLSKPAVSAMGTGLIPRLNAQNLYIVIGILGATVMPHNLYLHSALVQTRQIGLTTGDKRTACHYNLIDSVVALNGALLVNAAILIVAGTVFFTRGIVVTEIQQAYLLLAPLLGTSAASVLFAIALLCSGQSSTLTGTMAGQIVMEGFLNFRMRPWLRRMLTRSLAIIPAALTIYFVGDRGTYGLLLLSQVILSMQLPFAVIPLIHFTSDRRRMSDFANRQWVVVLSWLTAAVILGLNTWLIREGVAEWLGSAGWFRPYAVFLVVAAGAMLLGLLLWVTLEPLLERWGVRFGRAPVTLPATAVSAAETPVYRRILVPLDHTSLDHQAIAHAAAMARMHHAKLYLLHVEEGVTSQVYGSLSSTAEVKAGRKYLDEIVRALRDEGLDVETVVAHSSKPNREIVRCAREIQPDLLIMGAHGHGGLKDLIFGTTINSVRHKLRAPILIVRGAPQ